MVARIVRFWLPAICIFAGFNPFSSPQSQLKVGYALLNADTGNVVPVGSALFSYTNSEGVLICQAGVAAAEPISSGRIFVDEAGAHTGIAIANPSQQDATVTLTLRDATGSEVKQTNIKLAAGKHLPTFIYQLFSDLSSTFTGSLTFESTQKLAAITLRQTLNALGEPLYTTLPVVDLSASASNQPLVFPQIAAGGGYITQLLLINTTSQQLAGRISLTDSSGSPLPLILNGVSSSAFSYSLDPHGTYRAEFDGPSGGAAGYAVVTPDQGTSAPAGSAVFQFKQNNSLVTEAGVAATDATTAARIFVDSAGSYTGVAIANPSDQSTTVSFDLLSREGSTLQSTSRTLAAKGHLAIFAHELFSGLPPSFTGLIEISSARAIVPITLRLTPNKRGDNILTTLPVADLAKPPTATSVVFAQIAIGEGFSTRLILINTDKARALGGKLGFIQSDASPMTIPLGSQTGSQFNFQVATGGGKQFFPGNTAKIASIALLDPSSSLATGEVIVNESQSVQLTTLVLDSTGQPRDDFDLSYASLSTDVATVDSRGKIQGKKTGFSTLTISSSGVLTTGTITVVAVSSGVSGFEIAGLAQDTARKLYLANAAEHTILTASDLKESPSVYAGVAKSAGLKNDTRLQSLFKGPSFLALDQSRASVYVSDTSNHVVRRVHPGATDKVETLAGTGSAGSKDGSGSEAAFNKPEGIALDAKGRLWLADSGNHTIRRINLTTGVVETIAGKAGTDGWEDGKGEKAKFSSPIGIALETEPLARQLERERKGESPPSVSVLVADTGNGVIRRVKENGEVETLRAAASSSSRAARPGSLARTSLAGAALTFSSPTGVHTDSLGNIYVSEPGARRVRVILESRAVLPAAQADTFNKPVGIVITRMGKLVVSDRDKVAVEISYGEPQISSISPSVISNKGGDRIAVKGRNFAPETLVVIAGALVPAIDYQDTQTITFTAPAVPSGRATLTVQNRGGIAQKAISVDAVPLSSLSPGQITTVAGGATFAGDGSQASNARLSVPLGVAVDRSGDIFIADWMNHRIRKVSARTGIITTVAGTGQPAFSGDNGPATAASLDSPQGVAVDGAGNLLIADTHNYRIRKVSADTAIITTIAGGGDPPDQLGDDGPATSAVVSGVSGITVDPSNNIYIADTGNDRIRRIDAKTGVISTVAGNGKAGFSGDNGLATQASLNAPERIAFDPSGNLLIADGANYRVRRVDAAIGVITTVAGNGTRGFSGDGGQALAAQLEPAGVAVDVDGNIFIADRENTRIRKVDGKTRIISTVAGGGDPLERFGDDGPATSASLRFVHGIALDGAGNLFIADSGHHRVRKVSALTGIITTLAGGDQSSFLGDEGPATAALLNAPLASAVDVSGNVYIADTENHRVRKVDVKTGNIATFAGTGEETFAGDGGPAKAAAFVGPSGIAFDSAGNVYVAVPGNGRIVKVDIVTGILGTVAGNGEEGFSGDGGLATAASFHWPSGIAIDASNNLFIADLGNNRIRRVDALTKIISTVAGGGSAIGDNGWAVNAALNQPRDVAVDKQGNLYIADTQNHRVRKVDSRGIIITVAGTGTDGYSGNGGLATAAELSAPRGTCIDQAGNLFIADSNNAIRRVDAKTQIISAVAGTMDAGASGDNGPAIDATLAFPHGVSVDSKGNIYIADTYNHRIRAVRAPIP